jgi:hypothetical protein
MRLVSIRQHTRKQLDARYYKEIHIYYIHVCIYMYMYEGSIKALLRLVRLYQGTIKALLRLYEGTIKALLMLY